MRLHSVSSVFAAALTLLGLCAGHAGAQTFKAKFGTGVWTAFGSVHSPKDDVWTPGVGPGGEFWTSPGGFWRATAGSPIRSPLADTWVAVLSGNPARATSGQFTPAAPTSVKATLGGDRIVTIGSGGTGWAPPQSAPGGVRWS